MPNKPKILRPALFRNVEEVLAYNESHGEIPPSLVKAAAARCGYSPRHFSRVLKERLVEGDNETDPIDRDFELDEDTVTRLFLNLGNMAATYRDLKRAGIANLPSLSTFKRHVVEAVGSAQLAYARRGTVGFRDQQLYLTSHYGHRMHTVLLDTCDLDILVVPRRHKNPVRPCLTSVLDAETRYLLSWVITFGPPTSDEVRAALIQAIGIGYAPDGRTLIGGRPDRAQWDRGKEFLADIITESCLRAKIIPSPLPAKSPHLKGRKERFYETVQEMLLPPLPGYTNGPRDLRGNSALETHALGEDAFLIKMADWSDWYNAEHVISTTGKTPLQMWQEDPTPLEEIEPELLWLDFLQAKDCKVQKAGVRFDNMYWVCPELHGMVGRKVEVRFLPHDRTFIEIFRDNTHLGTAYPTTAISGDDEQAILQQRAADRHKAQQRFTKANRIRNRAEDDTHRIGTDKKGNRHIITPDVQDEPTGYGAQALADLLGEDTDQLRVL